MSGPLRSAALAFLLAFGQSQAAGAASWAPALPGYHYRFPRDFGSHPAYQSEWWYYTGNLRDDAGRRYGFELTFFRAGVQHRVAHGSAWDIDNLYFAHFAVSDVDGKKFSFFQRAGREALGMAGASTADERAWIGDWQAVRERSGAHELRAAGGNFALDLRAVPAKPPAIHGRDGVSRKGACRTCASHYYSFTRLEVQGRLTVDGRTRPVGGLAWNDHEWSSGARERGVAGWDWFCVQLDNGDEVMLYRLRRGDGSTVPQSSGSVVWRGGAVSYVPLHGFSTAATGRWSNYPSGWRVTLSAYRAQLRIEPLLQDQELKTAVADYWEGACRVAGTFEGRPVTGVGYTELTGYSKGQSQL